MPIGADNVAAVNASRGIYDRDGNTMKLTSDVTITTTDGMVAKLKSVFLDMGKGTMKTDDPVDVSRGGSQITADSMSVLDNGKVLVFEKRVRVNIDPAALKAARGKERRSECGSIVRHGLRPRLRRCSCWALAPCAGAVRRRPGSVSGLKLSGDEPIQIESDKLEVREAENVAIFTGNVNVVQGPTLLKAGKMTVYYVKDQAARACGAATGSANIDQLEVDDKVYIKSDTQVATGDAAPST